MHVRSAGHLGKSRFRRFLAAHHHCLIHADPSGSHGVRGRFTTVSVAPAARSSFLDIPIRHDDVVGLGKNSVVASACYVVIYTHVGDACVWAQGAQPTGFPCTSPRDSGVTYPRGPHFGLFPSRALLSATFLLFQPDEVRRGDHESCMVRIATACSDPRTAVLPQ